jgi:hypothetical protein
MKGFVPIQALQERLAELLKYVLCGFFAGCDRFTLF